MPEQQPPDEDPDSGRLSRLREVAPDVVSDSLGALALYVTLQSGGGALAGAAAGITAGPLLLATKRIAQDVVVGRFRRGEAALGVAASTMQMTADELVDLVGESQARTELAGRIIEAAGRTTMEPKICALGRVLAIGLLDDTRVDEAVILADALRELEAPHVLLLRHMVDGPTPEPVPGAAVTGWRSEELASELPTGYRLVFPALLSTLLRHGLVQDVTPADVYGNGPWFQPTDLGCNCFDLLVGTSEVRQSRHRADPV